MKRHDMMVITRDVARRVHYPGCGAWRRREALAAAGANADRVSGVAVCTTGRTRKVRRDTTLPEPGTCLAATPGFRRDAESTRRRHAAVCTAQLTEDGP